MKKVIDWLLPIKTVSEANMSEHWTKAARRHKLQKQRIKVAYLRDRPQANFPLRVVITRIAPRHLDSHDNLPVSLKYISDAIAENLTGNHVPGQADSFCGLQFEIKQEKGYPKQYAVRIEIFEVNNQ
jgi:hypothetical protein